MSEDVFWCKVIWSKEHSLNNTDVNASEDGSLVTWDITIAIILSILSLITNSGILYLARITKHSNTKKATTLNDYQTGIHTNGSTNSAKLRRLSESGTSNNRVLNVSILQQYQQNEKARRKSTTATHIDSTRLLKETQKVESSPQSKRRWNNFLKLLKYHNISSQRNTSRKNGRYLKGLIVIAFSNLVIASCLAVWCVREVIMRFELLNTLEDSFGKRILQRFLPLLDLILVDVTQAIEIGSVLWIALDRTMALQWPMQRKSSTSSSNMYSPNSVYTSNFDFATIKKYNCDKVSCLSSWCCYRCSFSSNIVIDDYVKADETSRCNSLSLLWNSIHCRMTSMVRVFLSMIPILLMLLTLGISSKQWYYYLKMGHTPLRTIGDGQANQSTVSEYIFIYYNSSVMIMLIYGHFLVPFLILLITSLIIYYKVSQREKPFFSRQTSNVSKFSDLSNLTGEANYPRDRLRRDFYSTLQKSIEDDSEQDNQTSDYPGKKDSPEHSAGNNSCTLKKKRYLTTRLTQNFKFESNSNLLKMTQDELRGSTLSLNPLFEMNFLKQILKKSSQNSDGGNNSVCFTTPIARRKVSIDQSRGVSMQESSFETIFYQLMRKQHKRTWKILIFLLLGFLICKGPRAQILFLGWFNINDFCTNNTPSAETWLRGVSLWSHLTMILDPIVYGFWGNRRFRVKLKFWILYRIFGIRKNSL